jgi:glutaredoxin-related protein
MINEMKTTITMKIRITESQYNILVNRPKDVVFGKIIESRPLKYTDDDIRQEASKYNSLSDFQNNSSLYQLARKRGMLDGLFPIKYPKKHSDDEIRQEASKYNSVSEFMKGSPNLFWSGYRRKMLDDLFPDRQRGGTRPFVYSDDDIRQEALKYNSQNEFMKGSPKLFYAAMNRKMLDDLFPDRI